MTTNWKAGLINCGFMLGVSLNLISAPLLKETKLCREFNPNECNNGHDVHIESAIAMGVRNLNDKETALTNSSTLRPTGTQVQQHEYIKKIYIQSQENDIDREVVIISLG